MKGVPPYPPPYRSLFSVLLPSNMGRGATLLLLLLYLTTVLVCFVILVVLLLILTLIPIYRS